jgi:hypothetical protein
MILSHETGGPDEAEEDAGRKPTCFLSASSEPLGTHFERSYHKTIAKLFVTDDRAGHSKGVRRNKYGDVQLFEWDSRKWESLVIAKPLGLYSTTF